MSYKINYGNAVLNLPRSVIDNLEMADSIDIKTLLCLAANPRLCESGSIEEIAALLQCRRDKVEAALKYWISNDVISNRESVQTSDDYYDESYSAANSAGEESISDNVPAFVPEEKTYNPIKREIPTYSGEEMQALLDADNGSRRVLLDACQSITGRVFNVLEANKVVAMSDYLGLSDEHILMLFKYCRDRDKTSVHYVEKVAYNLYDEGVDTTEKLEIYLCEKEEKEKFEWKIRSLCGLGERALTTNEKKYLRRWTENFSFDFDMIAHAYEIMADHTGGRASFAYMDKVLEGWYNNGIKDPSQITENTVNVKNNGNYGNFDTDEFYGLALKKSSEIINGDENGL